MPVWVTLAMLSPLLVAAAAGASWVLVRSEAGGVVRLAAELLSALGHTVVGIAGDASPLDVVPRRGLIAWLARLPHRMLGCAGCTSWWVGAGAAVAGGVALRVDAGSIMLLALPVAAAAAGLGALLDAAWLALVLHGEWVREQRAVVQAAEPWRGVQTVANAVAAGLREIPEIPEEPPVDLTPPPETPDPAAHPHPDPASDDGDPIPAIPAPAARLLHPSMPVPRPPVADGSSA